MKLLSYRRADGGIGTGALLRGRVVALDALVDALPIPAPRLSLLAARGVPPAASGMLRLLQAGPQGLRQVAGFLDAIAGEGAPQRYPPLAEVVLLAPVPRPGKIVAVGRNYADHAKETGVDPFEKPRIIAKLPSSVTGPGAAVRRPAQVAKMDFEAELAVVIGDFAAAVPRARALEFVAGYTALNDLSAREFQFDTTPPQTTFAKSMDGFCPMGPWLVTRDEIADPQALDLSCHVNGETMQHGHTADMIFPVDRLIEYVSGFMTLEPGDVIATGTPAGIGAFRKPPVWLKPGDRIRIEISHVGVLENTVA
jgi:2-keto-4-pentenoate hydratase/2-oxohepta-3-ene-1,7-dioic acid hydratase in catechol pathway